jgi:tRNA nucleotidyltransferase (CCA-adding enzyme)
MDEKGIHHYFGHAKAAVKLIEEIASRLKLDTKTKEALIFSAEKHMDFHNFLKLSNSTIAKLMDSPYFEILKAVALSDQMARGKLFNQPEWDKIEDRILEFKNKYKDKKIIDSIKKIVNGNFILSLRPDIKPGPILGDIIKDTVDYVLNNNLNPEKDMELIKIYIKNYK